MQRSRSMNKSRETKFQVTSVVSENNLSKSVSVRADGEGIEWNRVVTTYYYYSDSTITDSLGSACIMYLVGNGGAQ